MLGLVLTICHKREVVAEITSMPWKPFALLGYFYKDDEEYFLTKEKGDLISIGENGKANHRELIKYNGESKEEVKVNN